MTGLLSVLAHRAKTISIKDVPSKARETAKLGLSDFFAVSVAGQDMPVAKNTLSYAQEIMSVQGNSVLLGSSSRTHFLVAALTNATAGHALDFDGTRLFEVPIRSGSAGSSFTLKNAGFGQVVCAYELIQE